MTIEAGPAKKVWTKPEIRKIAPTAETLKRLALAQGTSVVELCAQYGIRGTEDRAA